MKKILALLTAFLYLAVSSGLAVEIHHCMGRIADISLVPSNENQCGKCGMEKGDNKCCKDELKFVKLQDTYKLGNANYRLPAPEIVLDDKSHYLVDQSFSSQVSTLEYNNHSPPRYPIISRNIMNCIFRI